MKWIKRTLLLLTGTGVALAAPVAVNETQVALLPEQEKFIVAAEQVLGYREIGTSTVEYAYVSEQPSQPLKDEVFKLRTEMSVTQRDGDRYVATFSEPRFSKIDGEWFDLHRATTTKQAYELQKRSTFLRVDAQTTDPFTSSGTWTAEACTVFVEAWGAGGGGGGTTGAGGGAGGGGGAYSAADVEGLSISVGYTVTVGTGGADGTNGNGSPGGNSWFLDTTTVLAKGGGGGGGSGFGSPGAAGTGGQASVGVGTTKFSGGNGGTGNGNNSHGSSGGGGGAGDSANGGNGGTGSFVTAGTAGTGGASDGGNGGIGCYSSCNGADGSTIAGGGAGAQNNTTSGTGDGARGEVRISFTAGEGCAGSASRRIIFTQ